MRALAEVFSRAACRQLPILEYVGLFCSSVTQSEISVCKMLCIWGILWVKGQSVIYVITVVLPRCVASRPIIGWRLPHSNSTQITDGCAIGQLLCFRCMQAVTADTVIAYITHEEYLAKPMRACFCRFVWARYVVWPLLYGLYIASCDRRLDERYEVIDLTFAAYQPTDSRSRKTHFLNYLDSC